MPQQRPGRAGPGGGDHAAPLPAAAGQRGRFGLKSADTSFLLGQQLLPGHYGALSHALLHAASLREALGLLVRHQLDLCPLLAPHLCEEGDLAVLYWTDSAGCGQQRGFVVEMHMSAVKAMCRWLAGEALPWRFCFNRTQPRHTEQHEVHLGPAAALQLPAGRHADRRRLAGPALAARQPGRRAPRLKHRARARLPGGRLRLPDRPHPLRSHARADRGRLRGQPGHPGSAIWPSTAATSRPSSTRRAHVALRLFQRGCDNDAVARHLGFHDANNFRRSFKRWTGLTPMLLRENLAAYRLQSR
ncbi:AraC family transcriptional regulator ligand-binding domain-containing protein [Massilia sp. H-1]|nr:AraC family transcriptional regulator ligand-binding domain-containing protein [Massilia sp. H-1]